MPRDPLKQKIVQALRNEFSGSRDQIILRQEDDDYHLYVVSPKFRGKHPKEKAGILANILFDALAQKEWGRVCLTVALTPKEAREYWPPIPELNGN